MGITWSDLTPAQQAHVRREDLTRRSKQQATPVAVEAEAAGVVYFFLEGDIPTATHHSKTIGRRFRGDGTSHATLIDDPSLKAARQHYAIQIKPNTGQRLKAPIGVTVQFRFTAKMAGWKMTKPDCDNLAKTLVDAIVRHGWFSRDELVCVLHVEKVDLAGQTQKQRALFAPGCWVKCRTLTQPPIIYPVPSQRAVLLPVEE